MDHGNPALVGNVNIEDFAFDKVLGYQFRVWLPQWESAIASALIQGGTVGFWVTYNC